MPRLLWVPALLGAAFLILPLVALLQAAPWSRMGELLTSEETRDASLLSLQCSLFAVAISVLLGLPLAMVLARPWFRGQSVLRALVTLPLVLPPVVAGVALLMTAGRRGLLGEGLELLGLRLPFSTLAVVVAEAFVAMPFFVITMEGALRSWDRRQAEAAMALGASPSYVLRKVTLPQLAPALVAGMVLAWARALGEFGATITFAGNIPGVTQTLPLAVFQFLDRDPDAAIALSLLIAAICFGVLLLLRASWLNPQVAR